MEAIDELLQYLHGMSDDQLLQKFKAAEREVDAEGGPQPNPEGYERLWEMVKRYEHSGHQ